MNIPYVMKKCNTCGKWLVANNINFYKCKSSKYGLRGYCIKCHKKDYKEHYEKRGKRRYNEKKERCKGNIIYKLLDNDEVVYIGKSKNNLFERISYHKKNKTFNKIEIVNLNGETLMSMGEIYFINKYKPKYNRQYNFKEENTLYIDFFEKIEWMEIDYNDLMTNGINTNECFITGKTITTKKGKTILSNDIGSCFIRKRGKRYLLYIQDKNGKQTLIESFKKEEEAKHKKEEIIKYLFD